MGSSLLRLLDANANRAREALRVLEDYARFVLDSDALSASLKNLRHELTSAIGPLNAQAIAWRDTPGDVGVGNKTEAEGHRADLAHVVIAAGKRLGEALRAMEEYSKVLDPAIASEIEKLRYRFYAIEQSIAATLRPGKFEGVRLYVLITQAICRSDWFATAEQAIAGGADCLQLREKEMEGAEFLARAKRLVALCRKHNVLCIINDRTDIALLSGADGVHLGQGDLPATEARKILGPGKIIGVSTHNIGQARQAVLDGADYIGVGPVFRSSTKTRDFLPGLDYAREVARNIKIPAVAIAGITLENVEQVIEAGVSRVAVTAAVVGCENVRGAAERFKKKLAQ